MDVSLSEDKTTSIELGMLVFQKIKPQAFELEKLDFWKIKQQVLSLKRWTFGLGKLNS